MTTLAFRRGHLHHWWEIPAVGRPCLSQESLLLVASLIATLGANSMFWRAALEGRALGELSTWRMGGGTLLLVVAIHFILFALPSGRWTIKPWLILLSLASAAAATYMQQYTVFFDANMLRNILHTQVGEARELLTLSMLIKVSAMAALPVVIILWVKVPKRSWRRALGMRAAALAAALLVAACGAWLAAQDLSSLMRNQREARYLVTPANLIVAGLRVAGSDVHAAAAARAVVADDARRRVAGGNRRPLLLVLVVGETVRAANWGLNGYQRQTTPNLSQLDVINFPDVTACGTSTEVSLPCMFSVMGRHDYDEEQIRNSDSLLHVVSRAGISTRWIDNQTGCKGVCADLPSEQLGVDLDPEFCDGEHCLDELLVGRLAANLDPQRGDTMIVLHPLGNHGPAYYLRHPPAFARFQPGCESADLGDCSAEQITNSYDNAVLYGDYWLAKVIALLKQTRGYDSAMIYVSDHGESLGELGLYLHGVPYAIAPAQQTHVPMVAWLSENLRDRTAIDPECLRAEAAKPASHDNLFHSVLGLLEIETTVYEPALDLFQSCRPSRQTG